MQHETEPGRLPEDLPEQTQPEEMPQGEAPEEMPGRGPESEGELGDMTTGPDRGVGTTAG